MYGLLIRRIFPFLNRRRHDTLLRVLAALLAVAMLASGLARTAPAHAAGTYPPADLLNNAALRNISALQGQGNSLYAATTAQIQSLQNLEQQAVANTLTDHGLPSSDADAAQSWGRDDAEAELWALLVQAIRTPQASRTADQQHAVDWLTAVEQRQGVQAADDAGLEYVKWAGFDQTGYQNLLAGNPSESDLQTFLTGTPLNYNNSDPSKATGGYCVYRSPAPDQGDYTGYNNQSCFTPCTSVAGCIPNPPSYAQFVKWGADDADYAAFNTNDFGTASRNIGIGIGVGIAAGAATAALAVVPAALATVGSSTLGAASTLLFPFALAVATTAAAIAGLVTLVIAAIVVTVIETIDLLNAAALPGQLATLITSAPTSTPDLGAILNDAKQATGLYGLFVGATLPTPLPKTCDNTVIVGPGQPIPTPCLNASAIPDPAPADPEFSIQAKGATTPTIANSLSWKDAAAQTTTTARLSGNWFVDQVTAADGSATTVQTLRITYTDWSGTERTAWLYGDPTNGYQFLGVADPTSGSTIDPSTCIADGTCFYSPSIDYVGTDGKDYSASVVLSTPTVNPTTSANPVEGSPVTFTANGASSAGLPITYQWQFEQPGDTDMCSIVQGVYTCSYNYSSPVSGATASYTWPTSGTFHVQLTATDSDGKQTVDTFTVTVGDVPPTLALSPACPGTSPCDTRTVSPGSATTLTGAITHTGSGDTETVTVDWGDGTSDTASVGGVIYVGSSLTLTAASSTAIKLSDTHTYATAGSYTVTVTVTDQSGGTASATATETVQDTTTVTWQPPAAITYGTALGADQLDATASTTIWITTPSGSLAFRTDPVPGTFTYSVDGHPIDTSTPLSAGSHTLTAQFTPTDTTTYSSPAPVSVPLTVNPAPLTITANDQRMTYGGAVPGFDAAYSGFVNGETSSVVSGLTCGANDASGNPVSGSTPAGTYAITCSGASATNYIINYQPGTLTISNPVPTTSSLSPAAVQAGGASFALTVHGSNFVPDSTVQVATAGGTSTTLTPSTVAPDGTQLTVTVPAATIATAGTLQVTVVNAAPGGGASTLQPLFVTTANAAVTSTSSSTSGTATTGGSGPNTPGSVTVSGTGGSGTVAVALYGADPGSTPSFAASSAYFDAYVAPGSSYSSVQIVDCNLTAGSVALWYNAATSAWVPASDQSYDAGTHCTTITVDASSTPSLAQLGGTPFAIADDPLLTLDEQGLPSGVAHQATLDGQTVSLPDLKVAVPYNSTHSYRFPAMVTASSSGTVYFTGDPGFSGVLTANRSDTATYQTMAQIVAAALASGGIDNGGQANALTQQFAAVQQDIAANNTAQALADLHTFADHVRAQSGQHISAATAQALLADAQLVYAGLGGTGTV